MASSIKDLVDRDCGGVNPLMNLTSHISKDRAFRQVMSEIYQYFTICNSAEQLGRFNNSPTYEGYRIQVTTYN